MSLKSPLARVRGLGAAKEGVEHWWLQRLTAIGNLLLVLWFVISLLGHIGASHAAVVAWLSAPAVTALTVLMLLSIFTHLALGLQVVLEDYIANTAVRVAAVIALKFATLFLAVISILSVLKIAFGG